MPCADSEKTKWHGPTTETTCITLVQSTCIILFVTGPHTAGAESLACKDSTAVPARIFTESNGK
jgi:hypothetical protein